MDHVNQPEIDLLQEAGRLGASIPAGVNADIPGARRWLQGQEDLDTITSADAIATAVGHRLEIAPVTGSFVPGLGLGRRQSPVSVRLGSGVLGTSSSVLGQALGGLGSRPVEPGSPAAPALSTGGLLGRRLEATQPVASATPVLPTGGLLGRRLSLGAAPVASSTENNKIPELLAAPVPKLGLGNKNVQVLSSPVQPVLSPRKFGLGQETQSSAPSVQPLASPLIQIPKVKLPGLGPGLRVKAIGKDTPLAPQSSTQTGPIYTTSYSNYQTVKYTILSPGLTSPRTARLNRRTSPAPQPLSVLTIPQTSSRLVPGPSIDTTLSVETLEERSKQETSFQLVERRLALINFLDEEKLERSIHKRHTPGSNDTYSREDLVKFAGILDIRISTRRREELAQDILETVRKYKVEQM